MLDFLNIGTQINMENKITIIRALWGNTVRALNEVFPKPRAQDFLTLGEGCHFQG